MHLLVTGGAGFIGSNFVNRIARQYSTDQSIKITVIDSLTYAGNLENLIPAKQNKNYSFVKGDIRDVALVNELMASNDACVHFAAESHVDRSISSSSEFVSTNVLGTHTLLEAALKNNLKTFVHVSTDEVYGSILEGSWGEEEPLLPNSPYSASKASSDLLARAFHRTHGLDVRITRSSNNYGHNQYPEKLIPLFVSNLIEGKQIPVYGEGNNVRDWLHVDDHCDGIQLVLEKGRAGEIYNIGGGTELTNLEITHEILKIMELPESLIKYVEDRKGHDIRYSVSIDKIKKELGYSPKVTFAEGLASTVEWYKNNRNWWHPLKYPND